MFANPISTRECSAAGLKPSGVVIHKRFQHRPRLSGLGIVKESMNKDIRAYNSVLEKDENRICNVLAKEIDLGLPEAESKVWHRTAVWFLNENPVVGYAKRKDGIQLLFWSGQSFDEESLEQTGSFKAAQARYAKASEINSKDLQRWLKKARLIQWDYKNIVKRKGKLVRLK